MSSLKENINFKGVLSDFIKTIKDSMYHYYSIRDDKITERLVRYYITKSIIPRPVREGKEFFYLYEHVLKFLYARKQIIDGWPMIKLIEIMKFEENKYFEIFFDTISQSDNNFDSMSLIKEFKAENEYSNESKFRTRSNPLSYRKRADIPNLQDALFEIEADLGNVVKQEFTTLQLSSWLVLLIENHKLSGMTYELSRKIGDAISAALIERNPMTSQELQTEFSQYREYEELKYKMEKLSQENEYLQHKLEEEKQEKHEKLNLKSDVIRKLNLYLEQYYNSRELVKRNNVTSDNFFSSSLNEFKAKLTSFDPQSFEKQMPDLLKTFEKILREFEAYQKIDYQKDEETNRLQIEIEQIASILKK